uniref:Zinc finger C2HC domain-containing protein 1A n=1 Tax=Podarcis muralis TaxID=64176 RepID=A0A670IH34_PODMU
MKDNGSVGPAEDLLPCKICGRTFFPNALKKHVPICQRAANKKRKAFDSSRQRAEGTDISTVKPLKPRPEPPKKQSNWRRKHEELIAAIRAAKGVDQVLKEGGKLPPPPPPTYDPDYIQCPYCQRRFNESAADRHINFCKEQAARITNKGKVVTDSKGKLPTRTQSYLGSQTESVPEVRSTSKTFGNQSAAPAASQKPRKPLWMFRFQRTFTNRNTHFRICGFREPECPSTKAFGIQVQVAISKEDASIRNNTTSLITPTTTKGSMKSRTVAPTNMARNAGIGMMANKRKSYSTENYSNRYDTIQTLPYLFPQDCFKNQDCYSGKRWCNLSFL